jgi:hypothetical protein
VPFRKRRAINGTAPKIADGPFGPETKDAAWTPRSLRCGTLCLPRMTLLSSSRPKARTERLSTQAHCRVEDRAMTLHHNPA